VLLVEYSRPRRTLEASPAVDASCTRELTEDWLRINRRLEKEDKQPGSAIFDMQRVKLLPYTCALIFVIVFFAREPISRNLHTCARNKIARNVFVVLTVACKMMQHLLGSNTVRIN
jgi:hypothetical protein